MLKPSVRSRILTFEELKLVQQSPFLADSAGNPIPDKHVSLKFLSQAQLGLATTQPKKFMEMTLPVASQSKNVRIVNAIEWLSWWLSADETSRSYMGNAFEKLMSVADRIYDHMGYDQFAAHMKNHGLDGKTSALIFNDAGTSMTTNYSAEPEFQRSLHEVSPGGWPGVETGPIYDAQGGVAAFYSSFKAMSTRFQNEGKTVDSRGWDEALYLMFKPAPRLQDIKILCFEAKVPVIHHTDPHPSRDGDVMTSHNFLSVDPEWLPEKAGQRISDYREEYLAHYSPMALAMKEMLRVMEVAPSPLPAFSHVAADVKGHAKPLVVATQSNFIEMQNGSHKPRLGDRSIYQTTQYGPSDHGVIDSLCQHADGIVLTPHSDAVLKNWGKSFLDLFDLWCSLLVSKQVCTEQFFGKPLMVQTNKRHVSYAEAFNGTLDWDDPQVERAFVDSIAKVDPASDPWLQFIMLTRYLHEKNFVKQEPHFLFEQVPCDAPDLGGNLQAMMEEGRKNRMPVPEYKTEYFGRDRTDLFEVTVLGSAGTRVEFYIKEAEDLGYWCAAEGMHVRTGGGKYGIMGAVSRGVERFMAKFAHRLDYAHLSAIQMPRTLQFEGASIDLKTIDARGNQFMAVEGSFDGRMNSLFRSNMTIAMAPGIGTYHEIGRWLRNKHSGAPHLQNQKLLIVNNVQPGLSDGIRLFDPFLAIVPREILEKDLIVVPDIAAAKPVICERYEDHIRSLPTTNRVLSLAALPAPPERLPTSPMPAPILRVVA